MLAFKCLFLCAVFIAPFTGKCEWLVSAKKKKTPTAVLIYLLSGAKKIYTVGNIYSRAQQNNSILQREKKVGRQREQDRERYTDRRREREREKHKGLFSAGWVKCVQGAAE